jgi:uncharacterized membrane protein YheB (UPF0754 family)
LAVHWIEILSYARQPLVGAFTGYITTDVAIRLLFRPLRPWRILGARIPLTPGVFPSKRFEFAEKVGNMVGSHLLTAEEVRKALLKDAFKRELEGAVNEKLQRLLSRDLGTVASLFPADFEGWVRDMVERLRAKGMQSLYEYFDSAECEQEVRAFLQQKMDELLTRDLETAFSPEQYNSFGVRVRKGIRDLLRSREIGRTVASFTDRKIEEFLASGVTFRQLLPAGVIEMIVPKMEQELAAALDRLIEDPSFRLHLRDNMEAGFQSAIGSLQGVSGFFARLLDPGRIVSLFPEFVSRMEDEALLLLQDQTTRQQAAQALLQAVDAFLDQSVAAAMEKVPYRKAAALRRLARKQAVAMLRLPKVASLLAGIVEARLEGMRHHTVGSVLNDAIQDKGVEKLRETATQEILASLRSPSAHRLLERAVAEKIEEWLFQRPIGELGVLIPANARDELAGMVYTQLAELLAVELPPLVDIMNVQRIVEDKINSLDILDMENLLLDIMRESFMFLNLFGALLGFLIGILNLIVPGLG